MDVSGLKSKLEDPSGRLALHRFRNDSSRDKNYPQSGAVDYAMNCCNFSKTHIEPLDEFSANLTARDEEEKGAIESPRLDCSLKLFFEFSQRYSRGLLATQSASRSWFGSHSSRVPWNKLIPMLQVQTGELVYQFAKEQGWCPFQTKRFAAQLSTTSINVLSHLLAKSRNGKMPSY